MFFERKKALKRNVATRQPARDVGQVLKDAFEFELDNQTVTARGVRRRFC